MTDSAPLAAHTALDAPAAQGSFADLGVAPAIAAALDDADFAYPFPIQHLAIPIALQGSDLIGQARTGTGKTLAFGIPLLQRIDLPGGDGYDPAVRATPQALVMCPTRELALQVTDDLRIAGARCKARILTVYGGVGYEPQLDALSDGVDVVVGTPGRLLDLVGRRDLVLSDVKVLVLDEADEMLDLGFLPDVERLIAKTPATRQTMLFSATMPAAIVSLARAHLRQPVNIRAEAFDSSITVPETEQHVYQAHDLDKPAIIGKLLQAPAATRVMVFCRTKRGVQRLADELQDRGFAVTCIHGDLGQAMRERALAKFRDGKAQVIVATDVAARGIDVDQVTHVVNYDCPDDEKTYVHRIGRTGRAGHTGVAVTLVDWTDLTRWKLINKALDLPFDSPLEAYSTTPQLQEELGIPADATGRAQPARRPAGADRGERGPRSGRPRPEHSRPAGRGHRGPDADSGERGRRQRTRRRNGVPVTGADAPADPAAPPLPAAGDPRPSPAGDGGDSAGPGECPAVASVVEALFAEHSADAEAGPATSRRRRRRRRHASSPAASTAAGPASAADNPPAGSV